MHTPVISVVMSVYNAEDYLHEAIESVLGQTFKDFEFIISNNGSTDNTKKIITFYQQLDKRVILFDHEDFGFSVSLNKAIRISKTNIIARIDADDVMEPTRLEEQYNFLNKNKDVTLLSCLANYINVAGDIIGKTFSDLDSVAANHRYISENEPIGLLHPGTIYYKSAFLEVGGYRTQFAPAEDIDLWNRFNDHGYWAVVQQKILMNYRMIPGSEIGKNFKKSRQKYEWLRECILLRRSGKSEITWEEFLEQQKALPIMTKLNKYRKTQAKYFYRKAGIQFGARNVVAFAGNICLALLLQPSYSINKLINQRISKN
jgi:glycosyltransferase involved in cell wall biosynthesis